MTTTWHSLHTIFIEQYYRLDPPCGLAIRYGGIVLYPRDNTFRQEMNNLPQAIVRNSISYFGVFPDAFGR